MEWSGLELVIITADFSIERISASADRRVIERFSAVPTRLRFRWGFRTKHCDPYSIAPAFVSYFKSTTIERLGPTHRDR